MTNLEYIQSRYPLHAQRIVELTHKTFNEYASELLAKRCTNNNPLFGLFVFDNTGEGWDYWMALAKG